MSNPTKIAKDQARQGDVFQERMTNVTLAQLQNNGVPIEPEKGNHILAKGETTGHAHRIPTVTDSGAEVSFFTMDNMRFLHVPEGETATLTHEEHDAITFGEGIWKVVQQREYDESGARPVAD